MGNLSERIAEFDRQLDTIIRLKGIDLDQALVSILSDVQEEIDLGLQDLALDKINLVKYALIKRLRDGK